MSRQAIIKEAEITAAPALYVADALRREGKYDEARALLDAELEGADDCESRLACLVTRATVEYAAGNLGGARQILLDAATLADLCESDARKAVYHTELAVVYQLSGETDKALVEYAAVSFHWERAGRHLYAGCAENNVALLHAESGDLAAAREHLARARTYFRNEPVRSAEVDDTEAQICLAEGKFDEAERLALGAMLIFHYHGEKELLRQARYTLIRAAAECQAKA